jgi:hypothetical protein
MEADFRGSGGHNPNFIHLDLMSHYLKSLSLKPHHLPATQLKMASVDNLQNNVYVPTLLSLCTTRIMNHYLADNNPSRSQLLTAFADLY